MLKMVLQPALVLTLLIALIITIMDQQEAFYLMAPSLFAGVTVAWPLKTVVAHLTKMEQ